MRLYALIGLLAVFLTITESKNGLYTEVERNQSDKNTIFSWFGIHNALSMIVPGVAGKTLKELLQGLHFKSSQHTLNYYSKLTRKLESLKSVKLANAVFVKNIALDQSYIKDLKQFNAEIIDMPSWNAKQASEIINKLVLDETHGKIKKIVSSDSLQEAEVIVANFLYFSGKWKYTFHTVDANYDFPPLIRKARYTHGRLPSGNAAFITIPYKIDDLEMLIVFPDKHNDFESVGDYLKYHFNLKELKAQKEVVNLDIPKFKVETEIDLVGILKKMGMTEMFQFSGDFKMVVNSHNVTIPKIVHKAVITVDEWGTEVAVTTVIGTSAKSGAPRPNFRLEKAFYYKIFRRTDGLILFEGKYIGK